MQRETIRLGLCVGFLSATLRQKLQKSFAQHLAPYQLEYRQAGILWVCHAQPKTQSFISQLGELDKNYARIFVEDLCKKGLLERVQNPNDHREKLLVLTESGKRVAEETFALMLQSQKEILSAHLSKDEIETLQKLLHKCFVGIHQINI